MQQEDSGFYVIDAIPLKHPSGKPFHLEERLRSRGRLRRRNSASSSSKFMAAISNKDGATPTSPVSASPHGTVVYSGNAFIEARRSRLAKRNLHVRSVMTAQKKQHASSSSVAKRRVNDIVAAAERSKANIMERKRKAAAQNAKVKEVHDAVQKKDEEAASLRRQALEERLRAHEIRRRVMLNTPRSKLLNLDELSNDTMDLIMRDKSALKLQRWWRQVSVAPLVKAWHQCGLDLAKARKMPFEEMVKLVQSKNVIRSVAAVLGYFKTFVPRVDSSVKKVKEVVWKNPSRVFLSAYIIIAHPSEIMPSSGAEEDAVKLTSLDALNKFERWLENFNSSALDKPVTLLHEAVESWVAFYKSFEAWKERDTNKIVDGLIAHWMDLEKLWLSVKDQVDADEQWRPRIEEQQTVILGRLKRFGDSALERLKNERKRIHEEFGLTAEDSETDEDDMETVDGGFSRFSMDDRRGSHDVTPGRSSPSIDIRQRQRLGAASPVGSPDVLSTSPKSFPSKFMNMKRRSDSVSSGRNSPSPSPARSESPLQRMEVEPRTSAASGSNVRDIQSAVRNMPELSSSFGSSLSNEQLAHELTLDPDFALKKPVLSDLEQAVQQAARKAFFDSIKNAFKREEYLPHLLELVSDIKKQLMSMVSDKGKIATELNEYIDLDLIHQRIISKSFDLRSLLLFVISKMAQLCAPIRDVSIRALNTTLTSVGPSDYETLTGVIEGILLVFDDMKLDLANFRLQTLRPYLKDQAVDYERKRFKNALEARQVSLERTKAWLTNSVKAQEQLAKARNPEGVDIPENKLRYTDTFHEAILGLVFGWSASGGSSTSGPNGEVQLPETMLMDAARLNHFQNEAQKLTIVAALLILTQNIVPELRGDRAFTTGLKDSLMVLLGDPEGLTIENITAQIVSSATSMLKERRNKDLDTDRAGLIKNMVEKTVSTRDPVFSLIRRRISATIKTHVVNNVFKREGLERAGLEPIRSELESFSYKVAVWIRFNGEVYTEYYDAILKELI